MRSFLKSHLHPLGGRIIFWNFVLLLLIKLAISPSTFQSASLLGLTPPFDSREIIKATNEARLNNGLLELKPDSKLDLAASEKLNDMATAEYFAHNSPSGINPWYWIKNSQYQYSVAGENLAIGFVTAKETVQAWLNSPSHKANLLNSQYRDIGVAVKNVEINGREGVLVVQMFGKPSNQVVATIKTPTPTPRVSLTPQSVPGLPQTRGESVVLVQEISTDTSIPSVKESVEVEVYDAEKIIKLSKSLNIGFSVYASLIALSSAVVFIFFERNRNRAFKFAFNLAVLTLAIVIPATQISFHGSIF